MEHQRSNAKISRSALSAGFTAVAVIVTIICIIPYIGVLAAAFSGSLDTLAHLADTVLGRYTATTLILVVLVMTGSAVIGAGAAWLVTMTDFPGRRWMEIALAIPLAERNGIPVPAGVRRRIERMAEFVATGVRPDGTLPQFGDFDSGLAYRLGERGVQDFRGVLSTAAVLFGRGDLKRAAGRLAGETIWLLGPEAARAFDSLPDGPAAAVPVVPSAIAGALVRLLRLHFRCSSFEYAGRGASRWHLA